MSLRTLLLSAAALTLAGPALAGGIGPVAVEPAPVVVAPAPAPVYDWSGFYAGLSYASINGDVEYEGEELDLEGSAPGIFLGYNAQRGNFVFGGELSYAKPGSVTLDDADVDDDDVDALLDLSARLGYAASRALIYGKVGYAQTSFDFLGDSVDVDGMSYGLGVDFLATDHILVGLSYSKYDLESDDVDGKLKPALLGLRVGYKF